MTIELPIACSLDQQEMPARIEAWSSLLEEALITSTATDQGVRCTGPSCADESDLAAIGFAPSKPRLRR